MNKITIFLILAYCFCSQVSMAQTWDDFKGQELKLYKYGLYQNGKEMNTFYAEKEVFGFDTKNDGVIVWSGKKDGTRTFTYSIKGKTLTLINHNPRTIQPKWFVIDGVEDGMVRTHDNIGTYRYFKVMTDAVKFQEWLKKANANDAEGMYYVGLYLCYGVGVECDYKEAFSWFKKAADMGVENARFMLGLLYFNGWGVQKDYHHAVDFFELAAKGGDNDALFSLANCYYNGLGVQKDLAKCIELLEKSADQGDARAQNNLGWHYYKGTGVEKNYSKALELLEKAAKQGQKYAIGNIGELYYYGKGVTKDYVKAIEYFNKSLEGEDIPPSSMYLLSKCYRFGRGVEKNMEKAEYWLKKAIECEDEDALELKKMMNKL